MRSRTPLTAIALLLFLATAGAAPLLEDFAPQSGPPGTVVTITGSGFGTVAGEVILTVGSSTVVAQTVTDTSITFTVAADTSSGVIAVSRGGMAATSAMPFLNTRVIAGTFAPPAGIAVTGYYAGRGINASAVAADGGFSASTVRDVPEIFTAWRTGDDPVFMAVARPSAATVVINARSTAIALVFCSPLMTLEEGASGDEQINRIAALAETAVAAAAITAASAEGRSYLDDGRFLAAYEALLRKAVEPAGTAQALAHPEHPGLPAGVRAFSILKNTFTPVRLAPSFRTMPGADNSWAMEMKPVSGYPNLLHEGLVFARVAPSSFGSGIHSIENMDSGAPVTLTGPAPLSRGFLPASLRSKKLDFKSHFGTAMDSFFSFATGTADRLSNSGYLIPKDEPAVYEVRAFSGNLAYGTTWILGPNADQTIALSNVDRDGDWEDALQTNLVLMAIDVAGLFLGEIKALKNSEAASLIIAAKKEVAKAVAAHIGARGDLDAYAMWDIARAVAAGIAKRVGPQVMEAGLNEFFAASFLRSIASPIKRVLDVTAKVSTGLQIVERGGNLVLPTHFALERTFIVVGDPFAPFIDSFSPLTGRAGATVHLSGRGFPASPVDLEVSLCTFSATGNPPTIGASLPLTILSGNAQGLNVKLPEASALTAAFGPGSHELYFTVRNAFSGGSQQSTRNNREPYDTFFYRGPPEIVGVNPTSLIPGQVFTVKATGLTGMRDLDIRASFQGNTLWCQATTGGELAFNLAGNAQLGSWPLTLIIRDPDTQEIIFTSAPVNVAVVDPWPTSLPQNSPVLGLSIQITKWDLSNAADGQVSLYEAFAIAAGTLGRPIERHLPDDEVPREEDWISGEGEGGAGWRDSISAANDTGVDIPIVLTAPLPRLGNGDYVFFNRILDGSALPAGAVGLDLVGLEGVSVTAIKFQNFPGHGIHLGAGSLLNSVSSVTVQDCGGTGVLLEAGASFNDLFALTIEDAGLDGIHITGAGTQGNLFASASAPPIFGGEIAAMRIRRATEVGVRIDAGAADNGVDIYELRDCGSHGIEITGEGTLRNRVGWVAGMQAIRPIAGNGGDGIRIGPGASGTSGWYLMCAGNAGDGYNVSGPDTEDVVLRGVWTGVDFGTGEELIARPNAGYSVVLRGVRRSAIGSPDRSVLGDDTCIGGSALGGILLDDTDDCTLRGLRIGYFNSLFGAIAGDRWLPVGSGHAIHLTNGSSGNLLGDALTSEGLLVRAAPTGSGLLLEGPGTDNNVLLGSTFGALTGAAGENPAEELAYGVSIIDGASGNVIGGAGLRVDLGFNTFFQPYNEFRYASVAAVRLENVVANLNAAGEPLNANHIIRNSFGVTGFGAASLQPYVGVLLKGATRGQWIGGPFPQAGNQMGRVGFAGIHLDNVTATTYAERNRIGGNWISAALNPAATNTNPLVGPLRSHSLLISGGTNQVVGEEWEVNNQFFGGDAGVFIDGGSGHQVRAARVDNHPVAGVVLRDTTNVLIGGHQPRHRLQLTRNGGGTEEHRSAVLITGGSFNQVSGCWIGDEGGGTAFWANYGDGIRIVDSMHNQIGGAHPEQANIITRSGRDGVHVRGNGSHDNFLGRNVIGLDTHRQPGGNAGAGVRITNGAWANSIGGLRLQTLSPNPVAVFSPNVITQNLGDGVLMEWGGGNTLGNSVLRNSIFANAGLGIILTGGANHSQPPPSAIAIGDDVVSGTVASLASTPAGSRVELFTDDDVAQPEGENYLVHTTVRADGTWSVPRPFIPAGAVLTATVTNFATGDTSPFAPGVELADTFGFRVDRTAGVAPAADLWPGGADTAVLGLTVSSDNLDVIVNELTLTIGGTVDLPTLSLWLVHDSDNDGVVDAGDRVLCPATTPTTMEVTLELEDASLPADAAQRWLVVARVASGAPAGRTLEVDVLSGADVATRLVLPVGLLTTPVGSFPIQSADFTIGAGSTPSVLITAQPQAATVVAGGGVVLSVAAQGGGLSYQWLLHGVPIPGATGATYSIPAAQVFHAGAYSVMVSNPSGTQASQAATVEVNAAAPSNSRVLNLSTRGLAQDGDNILIPGFVVQGSTPKRLLIRAVGPTLGLDPFVLSGVVPDPQMAVKRFNFTTNAYEDFDANDDWMDNANAVEIADLAADLYAFELKDEKDAALLIDLPPGQYSVLAGDKNGASGIAIVELYDADSDGTGSRLINISNRGFVGVGAHVMIPGFVVSSEGPKTFLIRVVGPTLGGFGVPGTMSDPALALMKHNFTTNSDDLLLTNDNWGESLGAGETVQVAQTVSAFALNEGSTDAALVATLNPGVYTIIGSSADGSGTGVVLVEVYVVP